MRETTLDHNGPMISCHTFYVLKEDKPIIFIYYIVLSYLATTCMTMPITMLLRRKKDGRDLDLF